MLRNIMLTAGVAVGALLVGSAEAQAQWGHLGGFGSSYRSSGYSSGYGGFGFGGGGVIAPSRQSWHSGHGQGFGHHYTPPVWHDTSHLDYHGPSIQRHRLHFHVTPGHYDVHGSGHWDGGHGGHH